MKNLILITLLVFTAPFSWTETILQFNCTFPFFSDEDAAKQKQKNDYTGVYLITLKDSGEYSAMVSGNAGAASLVVIAGNELFNLFEITPSTVVNITTLYPDFAKGIAKAVHSRHAALPDYDFWEPTQFYGTCLIQ